MHEAAMVEADDEVDYLRNYQEFLEAESRSIT